MSDLTPILPQIAGGGTLLLMGYGSHLLLEWIKQIRSGGLESKKIDIQEDSASVTDAVAANALMLESMKALHGENDRLGRRVHTLEGQNAEKDQRILELRAEVDTLRDEMRHVLRKLDAVGFKLDDLHD